MRQFSGWLIGLAAGALAAAAQEPLPFPDPPARITYALLDGSYFVDDCLICGRPTLLQPLKGTFDLVPLQHTPPYYRFAVRNVDLTAGAGFAGEVHLAGDGTYVRFEEFARLQEMDLLLQVTDAYTNQTAFFSSGFLVAEHPFPAIHISLTQTNGSLLQTFGLNLIAAPLREVWFSTREPLACLTESNQLVKVGPGDLISSSGRIVKQGVDLGGSLGAMPMAPELGLDAVHVTRRGQILYSVSTGVWSELLGEIQHGDLLAKPGGVVRRNQDLLAAFGVTESHPDAGLDALCLMPDGEILFSVESNVVLGATGILGHGDILSDRGTVYRANQELLAEFHPAMTNHDYGLDALQVLPGGEIWFSLEEGFVDQWLGVIQAGDLLSSLGHRVFSNRDLLAAFALDDVSPDYGLDAVFVVTDMKPPAPPPRILKIHRRANTIRVDWDGDGDVFQLEQAANPRGPWLPCSPILPALHFDAPCAPAAGAGGLYRLREW